MKNIEISGLTKKECYLVPRSFDVVGDILIFSDFPQGLEKKKKIVGEYFLKQHKNIKVVLRKTKQYSGKFRTAQMRIIAGERRKETVYVEHGCRFKLHIEKTYFSPRLSTERKRIYEQIKQGEEVLVMFSGVAPYPIVISKNTGAGEIYGVEINPLAHKYAEENLVLNKVNNVRLFVGGVKSVLPKIRKKFDRILMPLPKGAEAFLNITLRKIKKNGIIHFYDFLDKKDIPELAIEKIKKACSRKKFKILDIVKCGQYSPGKYRICVDFRIL
ncbi:class I SAM-dependent methyltransferase family protein [Candidatus Woesearchaeota archaeon]|jgi:tRNA (guanine37-N1)-methyltransferase|nr:class I SAM-dependent methyltransferase family protein [Candidatus Woesearchaeota archaeon]